MATGASLKGRSLLAKPSAVGGVAVPCTSRHCLERRGHLAVRAQKHDEEAKDSGLLAKSAESVTKRGLLCGVVASGAAGLLPQPPLPAHAIQGLTAGRVPGLSKVDSEGFRTYSRPEGKSGGHGIGWSEIPQYSFRVPEGWTEEPVSIADLGGTEIDVRFASKDEGQLAVVVAPVLRFMNVGFNADVRIEDIGSPEKVLNGFAPEILGGPVEDEDIINQETMSKRWTGKTDPLTYYVWETKTHDLLSATAFKNRVFIIALRANGRQWRNAKDALHIIQKSFLVDSSTAPIPIDNKA